MTDALSVPNRVLLPPARRMPVAATPFTVFRRWGFALRKILPVDLTEAFGLPSNSIVSVVGGGGKTSLIFALAREAVARGHLGAVTTTTRFTRPVATDDFAIVESDDDSVTRDVQRAGRARAH